MSRDKLDGFRMEYGVPAVLIGWLLTFFVFCMGLTVSASMTGGLGVSGIGGPVTSFLFAALMFGFPVALIIGLPLALLIAWPLRRVHNQWLHVVIFALTIAAATAGGSILLDGGSVGWDSGALAVGAALSAAIGRASVVRMIARRNQAQLGAA